MNYLGDFAASAVVSIHFTTHQADGAPVAPSSAFAASDFKIYKNVSATERSSTAGVTVVSPFDSVTGRHSIAIDTTDNTDAGFYAAGNDYRVEINSAKTVDGVSQSGVVVGTFSIQNRYGVGGGLDAAGVRAAVGLASANLDTQLATIDTVADGIKAKTDQFAFTVANQVDANALSGAGGLDAAGIRAAVGLASANLDTQLATIDTVADGIKAKTDQFVFTVAGQVDANALSGGGGLDAAGIRSAVGLASANLDTQLATIDTVADAIKAKTDSLTFTVAGQVDSRVISMATDSMTADAAASDFIGAAEIAASASAEIADLIAQDWVAGDGSPLAIAAAVWDAADAATAIRAAVGLAAADLDDQLSEVKGPRVLSAILPGADDEEGLYFEMTELDDYSADNDRGPIGPITVQTAIDLTDPSVRLRFGATQMLGSRLSQTVKFIGTATAAATAEANVYDVHISIPRTETAGKPSGFYRWDVEAVLDLAVDNVVTLTPETNRLLLQPSLGDNEDRDPLGAP